MATTPQQAYDIQRAREKAKTAGHAARRGIDAANRKAGRKEARKEVAERKQFEGTIPIWGAKDPDTGAHVFRPGAKKGWWEDRPADWIGTPRGVAEGQAGWTKVNPAVTQRRPAGFGFVGSKVMSGIGGLLRGEDQPAGQPLPPPQAPPGLPPKASSGTPPQQQPQGPTHMWPTIKPNSGLPGPTPAPSPGLPSGQQALPAPGGAVRRPGQARVLTGQRPRGALGTGQRAIGRGTVIDTTATDASGPVTIEGIYGNGGAVPDPFGAAKARIAAVASGRGPTPAKENLRFAAPGRFQRQADKADIQWAKTGLGSPYSSPDEED